MRPRVNFDPARLRAFCERHGIQKLSFFGSVLREDFGPESDVDLLVEFEIKRTPSFFKLFRMEDELAEMLGGRRVDLRTAEDLSPYFREQVLGIAEPVYDAA